jgi:NitT/TauT family transport system ATP-binding protein
MKVKIKVQNISKSYRKPQTQEVIEALRNVTVDVYEGEFLSIVGPSGCGKSTLLRIIAGLVDDYTGDVYLDGRKIKKPNPERGLLFQDYALFPWKNVIENVEFGLKAQGMNKLEREKVAQQRIEMVDLAGFEKKYPYELSGGMKQRCALARLLATNPEVMLMDEPLAACDAQTRIILQHEILKIWNQDKRKNINRTVIWITHAIDEAVFLSDRVLVMTGRPGQIKEIVKIPLPRPRSDDTKKDQKFVNLSSELWEYMKTEAARAILE